MLNDLMEKIRYKNHILKRPVDISIDIFIDENRISAIGVPIHYAVTCITSDSSVQRVRNFRRF